MPRQIHKLKCFIGPYSRNAIGGVAQYGMVHAYTQRQAKKLLGVPHKLFAAEWKEHPEMVGFTRFVAYLRGADESIWTARGD
jgi:hypothetical protein